MALPLITSNMYFDTVLKAVEQVLADESQNQLSLGGVGWSTVRERFDPWNAKVDKFPLVNVAYNTSLFDEGRGSQYDQTNDANYILDCYASAKAVEIAGEIIPKDQEAADVLHALITKVYYTVMSPINRDMGLPSGMIETPWISRIEKFIPTESNIPVEGILAARLSLKITFKENPPLTSGVALDTVRVDTDTSDGGLVEQEFDLS